MKDTRTKQEIIDSMKKGLVVSCITQPDDIIHDEGRTVVTMAKAAKWANAVGIKACGPEQVAAIHEAIDLPIIGLWKVVFEGEKSYIITPTVDHAKQLWDAGARIIAVDCTSYPNPALGGKPRYELVPLIKEALPDALIYADCSSFEEAKIAVEYGADFVSPTKFGSTPDTKGMEAPNWHLLARMVRELGDKVNVSMEGHIYTPEDAMKAIYLGAHMCVVGSAITRPHFIAKRFVDLIDGLEEDWKDAESTWTGVITPLEK